MSDRKTVMKWLEVCGKNRDCLVDRCPFSGKPWCMENLMADALEQLNEQEAIPVDTQEAIQVDTKVIGTLNGDMEVYCCRNCRTILDPAFHYCPNCGQKVKWK